MAEILRQAAETDQHEDRLFGDARRDELPPELAGKAGRLARLRQAKARLEAEAAAREQAYQRRVAAHAAAAKAKGREPRTLKRRPQEAPNPKAVANVTNPDSRFLHTRNGTVQGYNAQAVTTLEQVIVAVELIEEANDVIRPGEEKNLGVLDARDRSIVHELVGRMDKVTEISIGEGQAKTMLLRPASEAVPGREGQERRRRPRPDGTGTPDAHEAAHGTRGDPQE